ncbi:hypothetical protein ACIBBE_42760 [Streptomyces sp. NPDC051644]
MTAPAALRFTHTAGHLAPGINTYAWGRYVVASPEASSTASPTQRQDRR